MSYPTKVFLALAISTLCLLQLSEQGMPKIRFRKSKNSKNKPSPSQCLVATQFPQNSFCFKERIVASVDLVLQDIQNLKSKENESKLEAFATRYIEFEKKFKEMVNSKVLKGTGKQWGEWHANLYHYETTAKKLKQAQFDVQHGRGKKQAYGTIKEVSESEEKNFKSLSEEFKKLKVK